MACVRKFVRYNSYALQLQSALLVDAITAIGQGLRATVGTAEDVFKTSFRRGQLYNDVTAGLQCQGAPLRRWIHGPSISKYIRQVSASWRHCNILTGGQFYICLLRT